MSTPMPDSGSRPVFVLVHGLWTGAWCMKRWERELHRRGHEVRIFSYRTVRQSANEAAARLAVLIVELSHSSNNVYPVLIGHSMGGLVALKALAELPESIHGDLIFLGTPLNGSLTAHSLAGLPGGQWLLGHAVQCLTRDEIPEPPSEWHCSMIAGTKRVGLGLLLGGGRAPGDGTVALDETHASYLRQRAELPVSHSSMLWSVDCVETALKFVQSPQTHNASP